MNSDDVIYLVILSLSIGYSSFYRKIENKERKKWIGTALGLLISVIVSGFHLWHAILIFVVNSIIILYISKRICHLVSFTFSFTYLVFFRLTEYFGIPYPPGHMNMIQMLLTLKLVGVAFEVNTAYLNKRSKNDATKTTEQLLEDESNDIEVNVFDILHYCFNYIGVLTGPYYRYKTFNDMFEQPFSRNANCKEATLNKMKYVPLYAVLYLISSSIWPISYIFTDEFYNDRSFLYRFWYVWPNFFIFRTRLYTGMVLAECVCTMAGLGAYPVKSVPRSGQGPSKNFAELKEIASNPERLKTETYDFETIHNVHPYGLEFCQSLKEGIRTWNICVQYWMAVNIHKRFPYKKFRVFATFFVSAFWHGLYLGHYICICSPALYIPVEAIYVKLYLKENSGKSLEIWKWIIWFVKMQAFSYMSIPFHLLTFEHVMHYHNSIYQIGMVANIILYIVGLQLLKRRQSKNKTFEHLDEDSPNNNIEFKLLNKIKDN